MNKVICGDCLEEMKNLEDNSIDAVITDPPYGLSFMGKKWDYDVPSQEIWEECLRVLKPGGYLLSFAGTRTQHRMAVRIEDAGFEIRDMIAWVYSTGFPKSLNIGKAVDKRGGTTSDQSLEFASYIKNRRLELNIPITTADQIICDGTTNYSWFEGRPKGQRLPRKSDYLKMKDLLKLDNRYDSFMEETEREFLGKYETDMGGLGGERLGQKGGDITKGTSEWEGWGTALKPALEPITVARKPLSEKTVALNCLKWGVGGINIDESRVAHASEEDRLSATPQGKVIRNNFKPGETPKGTETERPDTSLGRFPANLIHDGSEEVRECFPETKSIKGNRGGATNGNGKNIDYGDFNQVEKYECGFNDSGNASRFFYCAKASKSERNRGCEGLEKGCSHPTVKPIALMEYLVKLVTRENALVLDPFGGSGTTGIACQNLSRDFILIEREPDYIEIINKRLQ